MLLVRILYHQSISPHQVSNKRKYAINSTVKFTCICRLSFNFQSNMKASVILVRLTSCCLGHLMISKTLRKIAFFSTFLRFLRCISFLIYVKMVIYVVFMLDTCNVFTIAVIIYDFTTYNPLF